MYITWPSFSSMWWLTCLPHEITHASVPPTYTNWWPFSEIWPCWEEILCHKHRRNICNGSFWSLTHEPPNPESALASEAHNWQCLTYCLVSLPWLLHARSSSLFGYTQTEKCHRWALSTQLSGEREERATVKHNHATTRFKTNIWLHLIDWNQHPWCSGGTLVFIHSLVTSWASDINKWLLVINKYVLDREPVHRKTLHGFPML